MLRKFPIAVAAIILLLVITNPSPTAFKSFAPEPSWNARRTLFRRSQNWLIFSVYEKTIIGYDTTSYIGIVGNFWQRKP